MILKTRVERLEKLITKPVGQRSSNEAKVAFEELLQLALNELLPTMSAEHRELLLADIEKIAVELRRRRLPHPSWWAWIRD